MLDFRLPQTEVPVAAQLLPADESDLYDVAIIGGGPAGATAAVYAGRKALKTLMVTENIGGQMLWTDGIENYAGFQYVTGQELSAKFEAQLKSLRLALVRPARVRGLEAEPEAFVAVLEDGRRFRSRVAIIATGKRPRTLGVPGEQRLTGRGVTYCATCDAPLYAGQDVAVVGGGNSAMTSVLDLVGIARKIYLVHRQSAFRADPALIERARRAGNLEILLESEVVDILGQERVSALAVRGQGQAEVRGISVAAVFIEIGSEPNTEFLEGLVELTTRAEVRVSCRTETSRPGLFAAGDVTDVFEKQIVIAAGEGAKAALAAHAYLLSR